MNNMAKLVITLKKSLIGRKPGHAATAHALGLRKIRKTVTVNDNPAIRGMVNKIQYLLDVQEIA